MKKSGVIEINGRRYSAHDGKPLNNHVAAPAVKAVKANPKLAVSRQKAPYAKRHPQLRSQLLMRQAVRPPEAYVRITYKANGSLEPVMVETNLPVVRTAMRTKHAAQIHQSEAIKHFDKYARSNYVNAAPNLPAYVPPTISDIKPSGYEQPRVINKPRTSSDILELALMNVNLSEPTYLPNQTPFHKLKRRTNLFAR